MRRVLFLSFFEPWRPAGALILRLFLGATLILGTQDNVFHSERMLEFRDFLAISGFPLPLFSAYLSAYAQFIAGMMLLPGLLTRWASLVMVINFAVAFLMVHVGLPLSENISPLAMLFCSLFFLFHGGGRFSLDERLTRSESREGRSDG